MIKFFFKTSFYFLFVFLNLFLFEHIGLSTQNITDVNKSVEDILIEHSKALSVHVSHLNPNISYEKVKEEFETKEENIHKAFQDTGVCLGKLEERFGFIEKTQDKNVFEQKSGPGKTNLHSLAEFDKWIFEKGIKNITWTTTSQEAKEAAHKVFEPQSSFSYNYGGEVPYEEEKKCNTLVYKGGRLSSDIVCPSTFKVSGKAPYKGSIVCTHSHHTCYCNALAELILNYRNVLHDYEHYKAAYEVSIKQVQDYKEIEKTLKKLREENIATAEKISLSFRRTGESFNNQFKNINETAKTLKAFANDSEVRNQQIMTLLTYKDVRKEKESSALLDKHKQELEYLKQTYKTELENQNLKKEGEKNKQSEGNKAEIDVATRFLLRNVFHKLVKKDGIKTEVASEYAVILSDKNKELKEVIEKFEDFVNKYI